MAIDANRRLRTSILPQQRMICYSTCGLHGHGSFPASSLGDGIVGKFENLDVVLPVEYDVYLKALYGDYMKLPPIEQRILKHACVVIDPDKPYTNYLLGQEGDSNVMRTP